MTTDQAHDPHTASPVTPGRLAKAAANNIVWGYASFVLAKVLVFGSTAALARLLSPEDFGIVGFALVIIGWLDLTRDLGVGAALIARPVVDRRIASSAFFTTIAWSVVLAGALIVSAPALGQVFGSPGMVPVAQVLSLGFVVTALGSVHDSMLYRDLAMHRRIIPEVCQALVKGVISLGCALSGFGYWSLVMGQLAGQITFTVAAWALHPFRPSWSIDLRDSRALAKFGLSVVSTKVLTAAFVSMTFLTVAYQLGAAALGIFTIAYSVADMLLVNTFVLVSTTLFPVFARIQQDPASLRRASLVVQRYLGLVAFPLGLGLVVIAPIFVEVVYGPKWQAAGLILQLLAIRGVVSAIAWHAGDVGKALGQAGLQLRMTAIATLLLAPALPFAATTWGLPGVALVLVASGLVAVGLSLMMMWRLVALSLQAVLAELLPGVMVGLVVVVVAGLTLVVGETWPPVVRLLAALATGGLAAASAVPIAAPEVKSYLVPFAARFRRRVTRVQPAP